MSLKIAGCTVLAILATGCQRSVFQSHSGKMDDPAVVATLRSFGLSQPSCEVTDLRYWTGDAMTPFLYLDFRAPLDCLNSYVRALGLSESSRQIDGDDVGFDSALMKKFDWHFDSSRSYVEYRGRLGDTQLYAIVDDDSAGSRLFLEAL